MPRLHAVHVCPIALILFSLSNVCFAQGSRGSIAGKIVDQQNAVIPGASVTVKNVLTGVTASSSPIRPATTKPTSWIPGPIPSRWSRPDLR